MSSYEPVQDKTKGTCITAFRSGNTIAAIMCRLSKANKPYLTWYPLTAFRYGEGPEQISRFLFEEHAQDLPVVNELAAGFLREWKFKAAAAIEHVQAEEANAEHVAAWKRELTAEREELVKKLKALEKPDNLNIGPGAVPEVMSDY